jgi:hypothetical protein
MSNATEVVPRLQMLGLKCTDVPLDQVTSPIAALACFPMYMVANVHGWTAHHLFTVPVLHIEGLEAFREAFVIGEDEARLEMTAEHRKVLDSMLKPARAPDRIVYEYALETLKLYLAAAQPAVAERLRTLVAQTIADVARAAAKGVFGSAGKIIPEQRECIAHIAAELRLAEAPQAAERLNDL